MFSQRFSLLPPSLGDELLRQASTATITLCRIPGMPTEVSYELGGTFTDDDGATAAELLREMRKPLAAPDDPSRETEGGEA